MTVKEATLQGIFDCGIVAVVRAESPELASQALRAVLEGGINVVEITMTVPGATDAICELARSIGDQVILGAGTVLDPETARKCVDAGAKFIVSPNTSRETIAASNAYGAVSMPGALTPTEILHAWNSGADVVKLFPGNAVSPSYIKDIHGPFPDIRIMPTGGVDLISAREWLEAGAVALGVGGSLVDKKLVAAGQFAEITARARQFRQIVQEFRSDGRR